MLLYRDRSRAWLHGAGRLHFTAVNELTEKEIILVLKNALKKCDECLNEDVISAAIISAENRHAKYAIDRDCAFIDRRCKETKALIAVALEVTK